MSTVTGIDGIPVYHYDDFPFVSTVYLEAYDNPMGIGLKAYDFENLNRKVISLTGRKLSSFSYEYSTSSISTNIVQLNESKYNEIELKNEKLKEEAANPTTIKNTFEDYGQSTNDTWGQYLSVGSIPLNKFKSLYINTTQPKAISKSEIVDVIDLNITFDIHGISCDDLGICFVGDFEFEDDKELYMPIHDSWSMMRLTIDKKKLRVQQNSPIYKRNS